METGSPLLRDRDTICALATAPGAGAIAVIRVSGTRAVEFTRALAPFLGPSPESHRVFYGLLKDPVGGGPIDEVLVTVFAEGRSFTGEPTTEISCHGSPAIVTEILRHLVLQGARPAERGEFTYRAFLRGRLDLVQAESVLSLVESRTPVATRVALRQLGGGLSERLGHLRENVTGVLAHLEANIDFAAEDIEIAANADLEARLSEAARVNDDLLASFDRGRIVHQGAVVVLIGKPNAGKSSLLNALLGEDRAIVTPIAGTTRDLIDAEVILDGTLIRLTDTAGLRTTNDTVEKIGVERAVGQFAKADLLLYLVDATEGVSRDERAWHGQIPWGRTLVLLTKNDLVGPSEASIKVNDQALGTFPISARTGQGLPELRRWLADRLALPAADDDALLTHARHFEGLSRLKVALTDAREGLRRGDSPDLTALELQVGLRAVYEVLGLVYDDQIMDQVFAQFCLGK